MGEELQAKSRATSTSFGASRPPPIQQKVKVKAQTPEEQRRGGANPALSCNTEEGGTVLTKRMAADSQDKPTLAPEDPARPSAPAAVLSSDHHSAAFVLVGCGFHSDASDL